jgi:4-hydroxy-3-polyprenylbenzoate decarboxylase
MKILVGITGASGVIYGVRLIEELKKVNVETHIILSEEAKKILEYETSYKTKEIEKLAIKSYDNNNLFEAPSSGSFEVDGMIISPCSIKSLSSIANGYCDNLISRSAICCLKEGRKLVIVLRETPLDLASIKNIQNAKLGGAVILPAMPAFYYSPKNIDDLINFVVGKILDQFNINHKLYKKWK